MDNQTFKDQQARLNQIVQDKEYSKILDSKERVLHHLNQQEQVLLDSFYNSYALRLKNQLTYRYMNKDGIDTSDIIRGQIIMIEYVLNIKKSFEEVEQLKNSIEVASKGVR